MRLRALLLAGLAGTTLSLAACDRSPPPPPAENDAMVAPEPVAPPEPPAPQVVELPRAEAAAPAPKPAPEVSADQQVLDDADATGMTARVDRDADGGDAPSAPAGGNSQN